MSVIIPVGYGLAKVNVGIIGAEPYIFTFGFDGDVAEDPSADAAEIDTIMRAAGRPFVAANFSSQWSYRGVDVTRMTATGPTLGTSATTVVGSASLATAPPQVAMILAKHTARGGRMGRGRCFLPPIWIAENNLDASGIWATSNLTTVQAFFTSLLTALLASDCPPVLLHSDGSTPDAITSWTLEPACATQRRRMKR
jgi:hypothetical protein